MFSPIRICLSLLLAAAPLLAQSGLGSMTGVVQDATGGIIAGATVRLTQTATLGSRTTTTNEAGLFTFPAVTVGTYAVTIDRPGFKEKKIEGLGVNAFQQVALGQVTLDVGAP